MLEKSSKKRKFCLTGGQKRFLFLLRNPHVVPRFITVRQALDHWRDPIFDFHFSHIAPRGRFSLLRCQPETLLASAAARTSRVTKRCPGGPLGEEAPSTCLAQHHGTCSQFTNLTPTRVAMSRYRHRPIHHVGSWLPQCEKLRDRTVWKFRKMF